MALDREDFGVSANGTKKCKCELIKQIHVHYHHERKTKELKNKFGQLIYSIEKKRRASEIFSRSIPLTIF
jgi:hypothetical protein